MYERHTRDTVLLGGWLFADLFLGLMMIFLVSITGAPPPKEFPPTLMVTPSSLVPGNGSGSSCSGGTASSQCTVTVEETSDSVGSIAWSVTSDFSDSINFSPSHGTLTHGQTVQVSLTNIPCQNGSFIFSGIGPKSANGLSRLDPKPVTVSWRCKAPPPPIVRLNTTPQTITLNNVDWNGLLNNSQSAVNNVENQIRNHISSGSSVGFAIVYDGAPNDNEIGTADSVDGKVYDALRDLGSQGFAFQNASYYDQSPLFMLDSDHSTVKIDVFYLINVQATQTP